VRYLEYAGSSSSRRDKEIDYGKDRNHEKTNSGRVYACALFVFVFVWRRRRRKRRRKSRRRE